MPEQVLRAIAAGRTRFAELKSDLGTDPTRPINALRELDLIERVLPVGPNADPRRAYYRVADNFLAFWLSVVEAPRPAISRRLGRSVTDVLVQYGPDPCEIDAVILSGRERRLTLAGEAKWARSQDGRRMVHDLYRKAVGSGLLGSGHPDPLFAVCAREQITGDLPPETIVVTAADIFA